MIESIPPQGGQTGKGPFLWLAPFAPEKGWRQVPQGGMCLCAFLFVTSGGKILLGRYADHPAWSRLCGMESERIRVHAGGWTLPASHVQFGEDPRETARRIGEEILLLDRDLTYSDPSVETFLYEPASAPGERHYDVLFLFDVSLEEGACAPQPPWYETLAWIDLRQLRCNRFARQHEDVVEAWLQRRGEGLGGDTAG